MNIDDLCRAIIGRARESEIISLIDKFIVDSGLDTMTALCQVFTEPFKTGRSNITVLHLACEIGLVKVFDHIMLLCSDPILLDKRMDDGATALFLANLLHQRPKTEDQSLYMTAELVKRGADIFMMRSKVMATPFYIACESGYLKSAKFLLQTVLETHPDRIKDIVYRQDVFGYSVLHCAVSVGSHSHVCRWLTSSECNVLWPDNDLVKFVQYSTSFRCPAIQCALAANTINMDNIKHLVECGCLKDTTTTFILNDLQQSAMKGSGRRIYIDVQAEEELIMYLYTLALSHSRPLITNVQQTIMNLFNWFGPQCTLAKTRIIANVVARLIDAYPDVFTRDMLHRCKKELQRTKQIYSSAILLDWYDYTPWIFKSVLQNTRLQNEIVMHYITQYTDRVNRFDLDVRTLHLALLHNHPAVWKSIMMFLETQCEDPCLALMHLATEVQYNPSCEGDVFSEIEVRFLYYMDRHYPNSVRVSMAYILLSSSETVASSLYIRKWLAKPPTSMPIRFNKKVCFRLIFTIIWHGSMTPSQLAARILIDGRKRFFYNAEEINALFKHMLWVYNVRHLIREKGDGGDGAVLFRRLVLGPFGTFASAAPLPFEASNRIVAYMYEGTIVDLDDMSMFPMRKKLRCDSES